MHLQEIVNRIDQRLESLGISALEAERRAGRRDAIRNMRRALVRGKGGVTMRTIDALAPALSTTSEWLLTGQDKIEADETTEIILLDKRSPLDDDRVIEAFALAFQSLVGKLITEVEASILARSVVRIIRLPQAAMTQGERRDMIGLRSACSGIRDHQNPVPNDTNCDWLRRKFTWFFLPLTGLLHSSEFGSFVRGEAIAKMSELRLKGIRAVT
jgi:transcriptional regulator with XRE-family HTH domain